jgi:hypothetical protein
VFPSYILSSSFSQWSLCIEAKTGQSPVIYSVAQSLVGILANHNQACAQPQIVITRYVAYVHTNDAVVMSLSRLVAKKERQTFLPQ